MQCANKPSQGFGCGLRHHSSSSTPRPVARTACDEEDDGGSVHGRRDHRGPGETARDHARQLDPFALTGGTVASGAEVAGACRASLSGGGKRDTSESLEHASGCAKTRRRTSGRANRSVWVATEDPLRERRGVSASPSSSESQPPLPLPDRASSIIDSSLESDRLPTEGVARPVPRRHRRIRRNRCVPAPQVE